MKFSVIKPIKANYNKQSAVLARPSDVGQLALRFVTDADDKMSVHLNSDIYLLFNQERLNALGADGVNAFMQRINESLATAGSPKGFSDEALFAFIKSRHIQSMSELQDWSRYLNETASMIEDKVAGALAPPADGSPSDGAASDGSSSDGAAS